MGPAGPEVSFVPVYYLLLMVKQFCRNRLSLSKISTLQIDFTSVAGLSLPTFFFSKTIVLFPRNEEIHYSTSFNNT